MMVKAAFGSEYSFDSSLETSWQEQVVDFAVSKGVVSSFTNYDTAATRGFVFEAGANSVVATEEETAVEECDEISALLGLCGDEEVTDETNTGTTTETPTTPTVEGGNVEVTLNPNTPSDNTDIPATAQSIVFTTFDITAGDEDVEVESMTITRKGLGSRSDFGKVWIENDGVIISQDKTISSDDTATIKFNDIFVVKAGSTETLDVVAKMTSTSGDLNALEVTSMETSADNV
jgi:hypothetical protein